MPNQRAFPQTSVRIPPELLAAVRAEAQVTQASVSDVVARAVQARYPLVRCQPHRPPVRRRRRPETPTESEEALPIALHS